MITHVFFISLLRNISLGLEIEPMVNKRDQKVFGFVIYGPQIQQGQLMARIGERSETVKGRYALIELEAASVNLFRKNQIGETRLAKLASSATDVSVNYLPWLSSIEVSAQSKERVDRAKEEIQALLRDLGTAPLTSKSCQVCRVPGGVFIFPFSFSSSTSPFQVHRCLSVATFCARAASRKQQQIAPDNRIGLSAAAADKQFRSRT